MHWRDLASIGVGVPVTAAIAMTGTAILTRVVGADGFAVYAEILMFQQLCLGFPVAVGDASLARRAAASLPQSDVMVLAMAGAVVTAGVAMLVSLLFAVLGIQMHGGLMLRAAFLLSLALYGSGSSLIASRIAASSQRAETYFESTTVLLLQVLPLIGALLADSAIGAVWALSIGQAVVGLAGVWRLNRISARSKLESGAFGVPVHVGLWRPIRESVHALVYALTGSISGQAGRVIVASLLSPLALSAVFIGSQVFNRATAVVLKIERLAMVSIRSEQITAPIRTKAMHVRLVRLSALASLVGVLVSRSLGTLLIGAKAGPIAGEVLALFVASLPLRTLLAFGRSSMLVNNGEAAFARSGVSVAVATVLASLAFVPLWGTLGVPLAATVAMAPAVLEFNVHRRTSAYAHLILPKAWEATFLVVVLSGVGFVVY